MSTSKETAISAFDKLDQASLSYNQNHHADLSSILAEVPQHLSKLISHAEHLKEKCQNARTLFQNVIDINLEAIAFRRNINNPNQDRPMPIQNVDTEHGFLTVGVPDGQRERRHLFIDPARIAYIGTPGFPRMVLDVTGKLKTHFEKRYVEDGDNDAATIALRHNDVLKDAHDAHDAQDGIAFLHTWALVFQFEEQLRRDRVLDHARRVLTKAKDVQARSYTKNGVPFLMVISGRSPNNLIEEQNRTLTERVVLADLFISFYSDVVQTLQFVHDNLDSFRTIHRKLSEEMKLVTPVGADRRDVLREAVIAASEAYDAVKGV